MFPKVSSTLRQTMCNLGLFSLDPKNNYVFQNPIVEDESNRFAVGQNFIVKFDLALHYSIRAAIDEVTLNVYVGKASLNPSVLEDAIVISIISLALMFYLTVLTIKKFKRIKESDIMY